MQEKLFSIVIPVYNVEQYLEESVNSVLLQIENDQNDIEIILVDDGSTDNSGRICDELVKEYPELIKAYHKENEGLLLTRRFGFLRANGKYIVNCDSDDTYEPFALNELRRILGFTEPDVIIYNANSWDGDLKSPYYKDVFTQEEMCEVQKNDVLNEYFKTASVVSMCGKIFKRDCLDFEKDYSKYYKQSFGEDTIQSAEIYTNAERIVYLNKELYNYRCGSGMTQKFNQRYFNEFKLINQDIEQYSQKWKLDDFNHLLAEKIFTGVARAITQSRYNKQMSKRERFLYFDKIRQDELVKKYERYYMKDKTCLKKSYKLINELFLKQMYGLLDMFLRIKNFVS